MAVNLLCDAKLDAVLAGNYYEVSKIIKVSFVEHNLIGYIALTLWPNCCFDNVPDVQSPIVTSSSARKRSTL